MRLSFQLPSARSGRVRFATLPEGFSSTFEPDIVPPQADDLMSLLSSGSRIADFHTPGDSISKSVFDFTLFDFLCTSKYNINKGINKANTVMCK